MRPVSRVPNSVSTWMASQGMMCVLKFMY
jgi:hypothetical protein